MIDAKICEWLMDNADAPIRYRVARELLQDEQAAKKIEGELLENMTVQKWLKLLKPETPLQHSVEYREHGCFDFCLENALPKLVQLGLHGGFVQIIDAIGAYAEQYNFSGIATANLFLMANVADETASKHMLGRLDKLHDFAKQKNYDIYISEKEKAKLTAIPKRWKDKDFISPELFKEGYCYPLIYDILGLHRLYDLKNHETDDKINGVISYISKDEFHDKISDGYGILISGRYESGNPQYHGMGWDPKYPGWHDVGSYIESGGERVGAGVPKLLFFAQNIAKYPIARNTKWFAALLDHLEKYRTESGTYLFPQKWMQENQGYAVQGHHISFGENRRKKNWCEIESTVYMQLLWQNV
ncbi:MAG: hypothetical protein FWH48_03260 [Oscillospiraceae bacterium]|nr:hypothetical protein [Oscillospiraceae bacterium]